MRRIIATDWNTLAVKELFSAAQSFSTKGAWSMKKIFIVSLAIFAVSTSGALAAKKSAKPKAPAATAANAGPAGPMIGQVSDADRALFKKSQRESGMKK